MKTVYGVVAVALMCAFFGPIVVKLSTESALVVVVGIGFALMLVDLVQTLRGGDR